MVSQEGWLKNHWIKLPLDLLVPPYHWRVIKVQGEADAEKTAAKCYQGLLIDCLFIA